VSSRIPKSRLQYLAKRGERPLYEYLKEIIDGADPAERLERYCRLDPAVVAALGASAFPEVLLVYGGRTR
jgi:hypothetical protein